MAILKDKYEDLNDEEFTDAELLSDEELDGLDDLLLESGICLEANHYKPVVLDLRGEDAVIEHMATEPYDHMEFDYDPVLPTMKDIMSEDILDEDYLPRRENSLLMAMRDRVRIDMKIPIEWVDEFIFMKETVH